MTFMRRRWAVAITAFVVSTLLLNATTSWAQYGGGGRGGGRHGSQSDDRKGDNSDMRDTYRPAPPPVVMMPHAGTYLATEKNYYEVVYLPLQTRIYLYDAKFKPISAQEVQAQMSVQFPSEAAPRQVPFQFVPMPAGATEQDYVVAAIDLQPLTDKEANFTIQFSGLSDRGSSTASFTPHFAEFKPRALVVQAALTEADRDGIARQRVCPVTGAPLGVQGQVVKLYVAEFPLYVANADCITSVKAMPQKYMPPH